MDKTAYGTTVENKEEQKHIYDTYNLTQTHTGTLLQDKKDEKLK